MLESPRSSFSPTQSSITPPRAARRRRWEETAALQAGAGSDALLRLPSVMARTGLRRSSIYARIARGIFPRPVRLSSRCSLWRADEVEVWCDLVSKYEREPDRETLQRALAELASARATGARRPRSAE